MSSGIRGKLLDELRHVGCAFPNASVLMKDLPLTLFCRVGSDEIYQNCIDD